MKITKLIIAVLALSLFISSCYKEETFYTEDYDLTITHYDTEFDFTKYKTFYITDSVGLISDYIKEGDDNWKAIYKGGGASPLILKSINKHFTDLGYVKMDSLVLGNGDSVDFAVNAVLTLNEQTSVAYYPGYWYGYPGYWGGYWGYGYYKGAKGSSSTASTSYYGGYYPWYGYGYSYTYKTGNLMIEMADGQSVRDLVRFLRANPTLGPDDVDAPRLKYVWAAFIDGYQNGDNDVDRVINGIDEAFENSPYLVK